MSDTDTAQVTLGSCTTDGDESDDSDTEIDEGYADDGLLAKVRDSSHPARKCGYCNEVALNGFKTSAHGRRYCPECDTVRGDEQRDSIPQGAFWA